MVYVLFLILMAPRRSCSPLVKDKETHSKRECVR